MFRSNAQVTSWDTDEKEVNTNYNKERSFIRCVSEELADDPDTCDGHAVNHMGECRMVRGEREYDGGMVVDYVVEVRLNYRVQRSWSARLRSCPRAHIHYCFSFSCHRPRVFRARRLVVLRNMFRNMFRRTQSFKKAFKMVNSCVNSCVNGPHAV